MNHIKGIFILLIFLFLGEVASYYIGSFIPGSVIGMLLLFLALCIGIVKPNDVREVATFLTQNMVMFFIPASVGIMALWGSIANCWGMLAVICVSTALLVIAVVGLVQQKIGKKQNGK